MNQFEHDQLNVMAGAWLILAGTKPEGEAKVLRRCAGELKQWLRHADTAPGDPPEGEPAVLPPMPPLGALPRIEE